jgi:hypothetical protein
MLTTKPAGIWEMSVWMAGRSKWRPDGTKREGKVALDVQPITGSDARAAARLCNIPTGKTQILGSHIAWLDGAVRPIVTSLPNPYVHLRGYASHLGFASHPGGRTNAELNLKLSLGRCEAVKARIKSYNSGTEFPEEIPIGDAESTGTIRDDDGYWRAVDVHVYNKKPPEPPMPVPPPGPSGSTQWRVRVFKGAGASVIIVEGDALVFQIVDDVQGQCGVYFYFGAGISIPGLKISLPGSISSASPFVNFTTTRPVRLESFAGEASFYQNPSATVGPISIGGTVYLAPSSARLRRLPGTRSTVVVPEVIPMSPGSGLGIGLGSASTGTLLQATKFAPGDCCKAKGGTCTRFKWPARPLDGESGQAWMGLWTHRHDPQAILVGLVAKNILDRSSSHRQCSPGRRQRTTPVKTWQDAGTERQLQASSSLPLEQNGQPSDAPSAFPGSIAVIILARSAVGVKMSDKLVLPTGFSFNTDGTAIYMTRPFCLLRRRRMSNLSESPSARRREVSFGTSETWRRLPPERQPSRV